MNTKMNLIETKGLHESELIGKENVVGVGIGRKVVKGVETDRNCITVLVKQKKPESELMDSDIIPQLLDGVETDVIAVGVIRAYDTPMNVDRCNRQRPLQMGHSLGYGLGPDTGTAGLVVLKNNKKMILSNAHVICPTWTGATKGDAVISPGAYDKGTVNDQIGKVESVITIDFTAANNTIDCALCEPFNQTDVSSNIEEVGLVRGVYTGLKVGDKVLKSGRTSQLTESTIKVMYATVTVDYNGKNATFINQIITNKGLISPGDSGSALLVNDNGVLKVAGLCFAGSPVVGIANQIQVVFTALGCELYVQQETENTYTVNIIMTPETETKKWTVNGVVKDLMGNLLSGVNIYLNESNYITNTSGAFTVTGLNTGKYIIKAVKIGFKQVEKEISLK